MLKKYSVTAIVLLIILASNVHAIPTIPYRIGGKLTIVESMGDTGEKITQYNDSGYIFVVTREDDIPFSPPADRREGLNESDWYSVDIPSYDKDFQPDGLETGDKARINIYKDGCKLLIAEPVNGIIKIGEQGEILQINIRAIPCPRNCEDEIQEERDKWDADGDEKIGLAEAIRALQVVSGIRLQPSR